MVELIFRHSPTSLLNNVFITIHRSGMHLAIIPFMDPELYPSIEKWSECHLIPIEQFFSYIMVRTSYFLMR